MFLEIAGLSLHYTGVAIFSQSLTVARIRICISVYCCYNCLSSFLKRYLWPGRYLYLGIAIRVTGSLVGAPLHYAVVLLPVSLSHSLPVARDRWLVRLVTLLVLPVSISQSLLVPCDRWSVIHFTLLLLLLPVSLLQSLPVLGIAIYNPLQSTVDIVVCPSRTVSGCS
jgi:hypothetical protein